MFAKYIASLR
jgi:hypothetical protein